MAGEGGSGGWLGAGEGEGWGRRGHGGRRRGLGGRGAGVATGSAGVGLLTFPQTFGQTDGHR